MVSGIGDNTTDSIQLMMQQMFQKIDSADKDGVSGLSKDELASINSGESTFFDALSEQFDLLDVDENGQLSAKEISKVKPLNAQIESENVIKFELNSETSDTGSEAKENDSFAGLKDSFDGLKDSFKNLSGTVVEKLISSYKNGDLSKIASSLNIAI